MPLTSEQRVGMAFVAASVVAAAAAGALIVRAGSGEVRRCQRVFAGLARGDAGVRAAIDWERLKALDVDVGAAYAQLPDEQEKREYERAFIRSFAQGFRQGGAAVKGFTNWRMSEDGTVRADYPAKQKTLRLRLSPDGRRVQEIGWAS